MGNKIKLVRLLKQVVCSSLALLTFALMGCNKGNQFGVHQTKNEQNKTEIALEESKLIEKEGNSTGTTQNSNERTGNWGKWQEWLNRIPSVGRVLKWIRGEWMKIAGIGGITLVGGYMMSGIYSTRPDVNSLPMSSRNPRHNLIDGLLGYYDICFNDLQDIPKISKKNRDEINKIRACLEKRMPCSCSAGGEIFLIKENLDLSDRKFICRNAIKGGDWRINKLIRDVHQISTNPGNSSEEPVEERSTFLDQLSNMNYKEKRSFLRKKIDNCEENLRERENFYRISLGARTILDKLNLGPCNNLEWSYDTASLPYCPEGEEKIVTVTCEDEGLWIWVKQWLWFMFNKKQEF
ncbi:MAG: hypothetical protein NQ127_00375 [Candidatus Cardinium sp.]|nr:hypothetical protein [Candidatus Cardinium sp.]